MASHYKFPNGKSGHYLFCWLDFHDWGDWVLPGFNPMYAERDCSRCGIREYMNCL